MEKRQLKILCENSKMTRSLYTGLLYLLLPFTPFKLLWRGRKQPEYLQHWKERFGYYDLKVSKRVIWLHCVSVGETRAASLLVKLLLAEFPQHHVLLTHTTPTGRTTSEQLFGDSVQRVYLPYDTPGAVKRFLNHFKPSIGVLMETELWFNLIQACKLQAIPLLLLNARLSEKSARGYAKLGKVTHEGLNSLTAIAAQTDDDAKRLQQLGANNLSVMGNIKFEVMPPDYALENGLALRNALHATTRPVFLAASTREDKGIAEENLILDAVAQANIPNLLTFIVPRHPQRFDEIAELLNKRGLNYVRRSELPNGDTNANFVLGDSMGEMFTYYAACDIAFIGGSLLPLGGQNLIEALTMGKPVLIGPHTFNFAQATQSAVEAGAAKRVGNSQELAAALKTLFADSAKRQAMSNAIAGFTEKNSGATQRALSLIQQYIKNR